MGYDFWVNMGTAAILASIKNPAEAARLKKVMLKIFRAIQFAYVNDTDFQ